MMVERSQGSRTLRPEQVTLDDFLTLVMAGLGLRGIVCIADEPRMHIALALAAHELGTEPAAVDACFVIRPSRFHGTSDAVADGLIAAWQRGLLGRTGSDWRIRFDREACEALAATLPGGQCRALRLADTVIAALTEPVDLRQIRWAGDPASESNTDTPAA